MGKRMCLIDDPDGCYQAMRRLNKASHRKDPFLGKEVDGSCFHSHWVEQFWWTKAPFQSNCAKLSRSTLEYRDRMSQLYNMTYVAPENCAANSILDRLR